MNPKNLTAFTTMLKASTSLVAVAGILATLAARLATAQALPPAIQQQLSQGAAMAGVDASLIPLAQVDVVFSNAEGSVNHSISGSYQEGFNVPCIRNCAHIELGAPYTGAQWISGLSQQVRGGYGVLGTLNNGLEPTGRHPFGPAFKVVLLNTDEATGTATMGLYFRTCINSPVDLGCSPYFMGPLPFMTITEEGVTAL